MKKLLYGAALILPLAMAAANADAFWHRDVHHNAEANAATVNEAGNQAAVPNIGWPKKTPRLTRTITKPFTK